MARKKYHIMAFLTGLDKNDVAYISIDCVHAKRLYSRWMLAEKMYREDSNFVSNDYQDSSLTILRDHKQQFSKQMKGNAMSMHDVPQLVIIQTLEFSGHAFVSFTNNKIKWTSENGKYETVGIAPQLIKDIADKDEGCNC